MVPKHLSPRPVRILRVTSALFACLLVGTALGAAEPTRWMGPDDQPLPFASDTELLNFFRSAPVVETKVLSGGINKPVRLTFERDGVRVRAIFRNVDISRASNSTPLERQYPSFRDSYIFEVAAYELSCLLGLENVPPAALFEWQGQQGSIQLWVEGATSEKKRLESRRPPADAASWHRQRLDMLVFDNLIYNFDRNHGNQLLDGSGKLWFIDHTRSFKRTPSLPSRDKIRSIDRALWQRLLELDPAEVTARLEPYLNPIEIKALLKRHRLLVKHIERLIAERGELQVLINLGGAASEVPTPAGR